ncbi:MAG: hypothetical protein JOZ22_01810, partial [Acidobacteriia bacterium]|nr:hypothetical protein [Terriglobia bacterium]
LAAAKRRFPHAEIVFAGPHKNYELFAADRHIHHAPLDYFRGNLRSRVAAGLELRQLVEASAVAAGLTIVIDPDTRLTQLGLLPVCPEEHYYFFESRSYGAETDYSLPELAGQWAAEILAAKGVKPVLALGRRARKLAGISVSLGVGDNPAKRLADPFEIGLLKLLEETGMPLVIDAGVGGAEADRVKRAVEASGVKATVWEGSFAGFARIIASSRLYVGYDSAGQHVAAAYGVPMVSIFAGFASQRMFDRWRPRGELCHVIRVEKPDVAETLERVREAVITAAAATA